MKKAKVNFPKKSILKNSSKYSNRNSSLDTSKNAEHLSKCSNDGDDESESHSNDGDSSSEQWFGMSSNERSSSGQSEDGSYSSNNELPNTNVQIKKNTKCEEKCDDASKQQMDLASVMNSLLNSNKSDCNLLSKASKDKPQYSQSTHENSHNKKSKKRQRDDYLEIVGSDGKITKVKTESKSVSIRTTSEQVPVGKRHFPMSRRTDSFCQNPAYETDVVKEKKLRSLATQGVVELFNKLEQYRIHNKQQQQLVRSARGPRPFQRNTEVSAIMAGKTGLIDFLMKKEKGGGRSLFGEANQGAR